MKTYFRFAFALLCSLAFFGFCPLRSQTPDINTLVSMVDASVAWRDQNVLGYTVTEHYSVFRGQDKSQPSAQMMVKTTYTRDHGKSYQILSETGSQLIRNQVLHRVLASESELTEPQNRSQAVITSVNYSMQQKATDKVAGQDCIVLSITPRRISQFLFTGTIWVDSHDGSIVQLEGVAGKSPSMLTGPAQVSRSYQKIDGYPMAVRATAVSQSALLGQTTIQIEYNGYSITQRNPAQPSH